MNNQKTIKARDPNWRDMEALRKSGAAGSHRDKKKGMKLGKVKHKGKTMDESIYTHPAGNELSRIGRILMDKSVTVKDDALSNVMGRLGDELTRYGEAGGASSFDELIKKVRLNKDQVMKMMKWAQQQKDTSLQKVKDPTPSTDDEEDDLKDSVATENTPIGHVDDERHMIRKELYQHAKYAKELFQMLDDLPEDSDFPHWWQSKVTKSLQMLSKAKHYLENELAVPDSESVEEGTEMGKIGDVSVKQFGMGKGELGVQLTGKDGYIQLDKDDAKAVAERLMKWAESDGAEFGDYDESEEKDNQGFTDKEIKMAFGVLNDPRYKGGNYTGAVEVINKIAPGLADHPSVAKALKRTNEAVCSECGKARFVAMPEEIQKQYESVTEEKQKGIDGKVCWKGYKRMGTKMKGGKRVDNCVKIKK